MKDGAERFRAHRDAKKRKRREARNKCNCMVPKNPRHDCPVHGEVEPNEKKTRRLDYEEVIEQIENRTITQLPGIMFCAIRQCIKHNIFTDIRKVVENVIKDEEEK